MVSVGEIRNALKIVAWKPRRKRQKQKLRLEGNFKIKIKEKVKTQTRRDIGGRYLHYIPVSQQACTVECDLWKR
jgi:hypothetical protein